jgi:hypothetical protein
MKRMLVVFLVAAAVWTGVASAQESPQMQLEFVRKLRLKGYHDLVKEYTEQLVKAQPQLAGPLSLEQARSLVALAREKAPDQRSGLFNQARAKFEEFVKTYQGKPEATQARLELAKLVAYHGEALLSKALREEEPKEQHEAARRAEPLFVQAGQELEIVIKQLQDKEQIQAKFERAVNYIDQARTYIDLSKDANNLRRSQLIDEAKKAFLTLAGEESTEVGLLANAWLVKCYQELQDPTKVLAHLKKVLGAAGKSAEPAQRLARYFYIQWIPNDPTQNKLKGIEKINLIKTEANKWLKDYPGAHKSWEGQGVRFELANAILTEAQATYKDLRSPAAAPLLGQAQKLYAALVDLDGDFAEEANRRTIFIAVTKLEKTKLEDIGDFENSLLKAQYEIYKVKQTTGQIEEAKTEGDKQKLEAVKKQHLRDGVRALTQALNLATPSTPIQKVDEARYLLMSTYYAAGDPARAAIAGEWLGTTRPPTKRAPQGIGLAFLAYDTINTREASEVNRQKLRDLAEFVLSPQSQKFWSGDPITSVAHYQLAMLHQKDDDYKAAIRHLEQLSGDFAGFVYAQGQLTFIALGAAKDKAENEGERKLLRDKARASIKRLPATLPADADPSTATMYYHAQMEEPKFLYADAAADLKLGKLADAASKYKQMGKFVEQHLATFKKAPVKFEEKTKSDLNTLMTVMLRYAKLGLADIEYRLGNYDKVLSAELVGPLVQEIKDTAKKAGKIRRKDYVVVGEVLGLALRTHVQKGDMDSARQVFDMIDRLAGDEEGALQTDSSSMMFSLVSDIEQHVKTLKKNDAAKVKGTIENYAKFIDDIADSILKKRAEPRDYLFLAEAYGTLEQPQKAAELYGKVPEPKALDKKNPSEEEVKDIAKYWYLQIQYAKALREGKDFKTAFKVLNRLLSHENAQYHILAEMEKLHVLEDNGTYGTAIKGWQELMTRLRAKAGEDNQIKKLYFDGYFGLTRSYYKYSQTAKVIQSGREEQFLTVAANNILKLENATNNEGWSFVGDRFIELMDQSPKLKETYEKLKKG